MGVDHNRQIRLPHQRFSLGAAADRGHLEGAVRPDVGRPRSGAYGGAGGAVSAANPPARPGEAPTVVRTRQPLSRGRSCRSVLPPRSGRNAFSTVRLGPDPGDSTWPDPFTYASLATALGNPGSARAVAGACAANPVALVIPCHRVIRSNGGMGGYRWGLQRKRRLLSLEASMAGERSLEADRIRRAGAGGRRPPAFYSGARPLTEERQPVDP